MSKETLFHAGQIVEHKLFSYRGVIFAVDPYFMLSDEWYEQVAYSMPPKDQPWYHVLVDHADHSTYVAERNLRPARNLQQIDHPMLGQFFNAYDRDRYLSRQQH